MSVENKLIAMMKDLRDPGLAGEDEWRRFATRAHRSLWGRRAAVVGAAGITAFVGASVMADPSVGPSTITPAGNHGDSNATERDHHDDRNAARHHRGHDGDEARWGHGPGRIILAIKDRGDHRHTLSKHTAVFGSAKLNGGRLFYKVLGSDGEVLAKGKVETEPCHGDHCRSPYMTRIPLRIEEEERGHLLVYIKERGKQEATIRIAVVLKPSD